MLNDPKYLQPPLPDAKLREIYWHVKTTVAPDSPEPPDEKTLELLCRPLMLQVGQAKILTMDPSQPPSSILEKFLMEINEILLAEDGNKLASYLLYEPEFPDIYMSLIADYKINYPPDNVARPEENKALRALVARLVPAAGKDDTGDWTPMARFLTDWFAYIGHIVPTMDLIEIYVAIKNLLQCVCFF